VSQRCRIEESPEKCTKRPAPIVAKNVKFHLSLILADQCTAVTAGLREDREEDINCKFSIM